MRHPTLRTEHKETSQWTTRTVVTGAQQPLLPLAMLFFGFLVTLTSASMGAALMSLGDDGAPRGPKGGGLFARPELVPIPVRARRRP